MRSTIRIKKMHFSGELDKKSIAKKATTIFSPLKRLTNKYRGNLVKVLRNSDDAQKWFGCDFKGNIRSIKILIWLNGSNGLVSEVTNQARPNDNFKQTTKANMPLIVSSNTFLNFGLLFDGTNDGFTCNSDGLNTTTLQLFTIYANVFQTAIGNKRIVTKNIAGNDYSYSLGSRNTNNHYWHIVRTEFGYSGLAPSPLMPTVINSHVELIMIRDRANSDTRRIKNLLEYAANSISGAVDYSTSYPLYISGAALGEYFQGYMKYLVILKNSYPKLSLITTSKSSYILDVDDMYYNVITAVSLKRLTKWYDGPCIKIRRSSDDAETDIYFNGLDVDTSAIETFCGAGDGYVVRWYDQGINSKYLEETTKANQPKICSSGSYIQNGIEFTDSSETRLNRQTTGRICRGIYINFITKTEVTTSSSYKVSWNIENLYGGIKFGDTTGYATNEIINIGNYGPTPERSSWSDASAVITANTTHKLLCTFDAATPKWNIKYDGDDKPITTYGTPVILNADDIRIGGRGDGASQWFNGYCTSFIVFDTATLNYSELDKV